MPIFDSADLDNAVSESGVAHEDVTYTDHTNVSQLIQGYSYNNPLYSADLVAYYPCDEGSGTAVHDVSGNNNDGTSSGGVTFNQTGLLGTSSYSFDGTDDYVATPYSANPAEISVAFWFKQDTTVANRYDMNPVSKEGTGAGWGFSSGDGTIVLKANDGAWTDTPAYDFNTGTWYFVVGRIDDGNFIDLYVNGVDVGSTSIGAIVTTTAGVDFGCRAGSNDRFYNGKLEGVRIIDRLLSPSEIQALYDVVNTKGDLTTQFKSV